MLVAFLAGLVSSFVGSMPIAGPIAVLVLERGLAGRRRDALEIAIGAAVAEGAYAALAFGGVSVLLARFPALLPGARFFGSAVIVVIGGYLAFRRAPEPSAPAPVHSATRHIWLLGFTVTALNPTLIVTWTALAAALQAANVVSAVRGDAGAFGAGVACGVIAWFTILVAIVQRVRRRLGAYTTHRAVRVIGWLLLAAGVAAAVRTAYATVR